MCFNLTLIFMPRADILQYVDWAYIRSLVVVPPPNNHAYLVHLLSLSDEVEQPRYFEMSWLPAEDIAAFPFFYEHERFIWEQVRHLFIRQEASIFDFM